MAGLKIVFDGQLWMYQVFVISKNYYIYVELTSTYIRGDRVTLVLVNSRDF